MKSMFSLITVCAIAATVSSYGIQPKFNKYKVSPLNMASTTPLKSLGYLKKLMGEEKGNEPPKPVKEKSEEKEEILTGFSRISKIMEKSKDDPNPKLPPWYEPGSYPVHILAALAYVIPMVDASDLGKYMFEAYPPTAEIYNTFYGALAGVYNGVPFLPFAVFFLMSYVSRAPSFPVEVRLHFAQAFMISLVQFVPSFGFGLLEKGGVPGLGVLYNTAFLWVFLSCTTMQLNLLLSPVLATKNPVQYNVLGWALRYMNYNKAEMKPKPKK